MLWGISEMVHARAFNPLPLCSAPLKTKSFQTFAIVFSTPEKLLVGIRGALGMKESHFLSYNMFSENAVEYLRNSEC